MRSMRFILILGGIISFSFLTETWYSLESQEFGFSILFPIKPVAQNQTVPSAIGELKMNMFIYDASSSTDDESGLPG